jgi:L-asparaginase
MSIRLLLTGGTLDKEHDPISETFVFGETHVPELIKQSRVVVDIQIQKLMLIDSLDITEEDQEVIYQACLLAKEDRIVITHGTSNMHATAKYLGEKLKNKTIVLTGSMVPFTFPHSDAQFNVGSAIAFVQVLPNGVYIAMNGKNYIWNNVKKNVERGMFEEGST